MTIQAERVDLLAEAGVASRPAPAPRVRRNLVSQRAEDFKPPLFRSNTTLRGRIENGVRRFFDLQAGSAWRAVKAELADARGRLLDVGCGAQIYRDLVPSGVDYVGIDTSSAKSRFGYDLPGVRYFDGDDWGVADASFDTVLCTEVLEHVAEPAPFLSKVKGSLRPGGRLVMTVPFAARWHFVPFDFWRYTPSSLQMLLQGAGFDAVSVEARGTPLTVLCYKAITLVLILLCSPRKGFGGAIRRALGIVLAPALPILAAVGTLSLDGDWGDDCLGYTVTARRAA